MPPSSESLDECLVSLKFCGGFFSFFLFSFPLLESVEILFLSWSVLLESLIAEALTR